MHTDTAHIHVHFLVSNCSLKDGKSFRRGPAELKEMCRYFGEQCRERGLTHSYRDSYYVKDKDRERQGIAPKEQTEPASYKEVQEIPPDYTKMSIQERVRQLPPPTEDTSQEFEAYKNRMGYDAAKMKNIRYKVKLHKNTIQIL